MTTTSRVGVATRQPTFYDPEPAGVRSYAEIQADLSRVRARLAALTGEPIEAVTKPAARTEAPAVELTADDIAIARKLGVSMASLERAKSKTPTSDIVRELADPLPASRVGDPFHGAVQAKTPTETERAIGRQIGVSRLALDRAASGMSTGEILIELRAEAEREALRAGLARQRNR